MSEPSAPQEVSRKVVRVARSVADAMFGEPDPADKNSDAYLLIRGSDDQIDVFRLKAEGVITVGRDTDCDITLDDGRCSRRHFDLFFQQGVWYARDLKDGSKRPTPITGCDPRIV